MAQALEQEGYQSHLNIIVTGFGSFKGVAANPTEVLVRWLDEQYVQPSAHTADGTTPPQQPPRSLPHQARIRSARVLRVSAQAVDTFLAQEVQALAAADGELGPGPVLLLHFGVDIKRSWFNLECQAFNDATFRCADEDGWEPCAQPIEPESSGSNGNSAGCCGINFGTSNSHAALTAARACSLDLTALQQQLAGRGHDVRLSQDAGRFVCNFIYYKSLMASSTFTTMRCHSLFVHCPSFEAVGPEKQKAFAADLLEALCDMLPQPAQANSSAHASNAGAAIAMDQVVRGVS